MTHTAPGYEGNFNNHSFRFGLIFCQSYDQLEGGPQDGECDVWCQEDLAKEEEPQIQTHR